MLWVVSVAFPLSSMGDEELSPEQLRDLVLQLRAEKERLLQERSTPQPIPNPDPLAPGPPGPTPAAPVTERLVVLPRERKCPMFNGKTGIGILEWTEEVQACMRARHLSTADKALFIFDHLEGEAKEEIKY